MVERVIRATTASGTVHSATAGRHRCRNTSSAAPPCPRTSASSKYHEVSGWKL